MSDAIDTSNWPSKERVMLPSRAFLMSWRDQTLPTRRTALEDSVEHFNSLRADAPDGLRDMAVLASIGDALQPLEDLAYLALSWDEPFGGLAKYVRATVYSSRTPALFWQQIHKRDDDYLDIFAGFKTRDPLTGLAHDLLAGIGATNRLSASNLEALEQARVATRRRLRLLLGVLAADWQRYSPYFLAYKHGGLVANRNDVVWVDDDVDEVVVATPRRRPSVAVWHRGGKATEGRADFSLSVEAVIRSASGLGRLAIEMVEAFVVSRLAAFDAVDFDHSGSVVAVRSLQLPWTIWLREADLSPAIWELIGDGPRIIWTNDEGLADFARPVDA